MQSPGCFDSKIRGRAPRGQADSSDSRKQSVCVQLYLSHLLDKNALRAICQRSQREADWPLRPAALRGLRSLSAPDTPRQGRRNAARIVFQHSSHVHDSFALRLAAPCACVGLDSHFSWQRRKHTSRGYWCSRSSRPYILSTSLAIRTVLAHTERSLSRRTLPHRSSHTHAFCYHEDTGSPGP